MTATSIDSLPRPKVSLWAVACLVAGLAGLAGALASLFLVNYLDWDQELYTSRTLASAYLAFGAGLTAVALVGPARRAVLRGAGGTPATVCIILGGLAGLAALLLDWLVLPMRVAETGPLRLVSANNLHLLGVGLHDYAEAHNGRLPAAAITGPDGTPLLSWRVAILPYLEEERLYKRFKLDEPWDGPHNRALLEEMPRVFARPGVRGITPTGHTYYRAFTGPATAFPLSEGLRLPDDFQDGPANTLLVVEAAESVPWTQPEGLSAVPEEPLPPLGGHGRHGVLAVFADVTGHTLSFGEGAGGPSVSEATLRMLITPAGGEMIDSKEFP